MGLECPTKLFYTAHKEYANQKQSDPFMMALAKGGFQVEEYARRLHAPGVLIESRDPEEVQARHPWKLTFLGCASTDDS